MTKHYQLCLLMLLQSAVRGFVPLLSTKSMGLVTPHRLGASPDDDEQEPDPFKYYSDSTNSTAETQGLPSLDAKVMKKNKRSSSGYKVLDNRDNLPFVVQLTTPDPYTKPELKMERARKNTEQDRKKNKSTRSTGGIAASIFEKDNETGELLPLLGQFELDKSTTNGDIVIVGDQSYQVQRARCQYKYAGGQRFEMVRKILEVKPILRVQTEAVLQRSLQSTADDDDDSLSVLE